MTHQETIKFLVLRSIGNFLVLFALFGVFATFGPAMSAEATYRIAQVRGVRYAVADTPTKVQPDVDTQLPTGVPGISVTPVPVQPVEEGPSFASVIAGPKDQTLVPPDAEFSLVIPKIGASAKVFPNVDPTDEAAFLPLLTKGIAHAKGTVFPGVPGNTYLFAHSTDNWWNVGRYNAVFYLLKDLSPGDEIIVFFEGRRYNYVVTEKRTVPPTDVTALVDSHGGPEQLVLQTCWPPGTTWERLLVIARLKSQL
ncbi:MAG: hypothetical protein RLZZ455_633 [Candidatus Parcubacteria bacterium]|jgi:sortase A